VEQPTLRKAKTLTSMLGPADGFSRLDNRPEASPDWGVPAPGAADHMERYLRDHRQLVSPSAQETLRQDELVSPSAQETLRQDGSGKLRRRRRTFNNYGKSLCEEKLELIALWQAARAAGCVVDAEPLEPEHEVEESLPESPSWPTVSPFTPRKSSLEVIQEV